MLCKGIVINEPIFILQNVMDLIKDLSEFYYRFYVIVSTLAALAIFPVLFYQKIVSPTLKNKKKYTQIAVKSYYDTRIYFKRFDIFDSKYSLNPFKSGTYSNMFNIVYDFYKADILILESSIIVFSKHNFFGFKFNWYAFIINLNNNNSFLYYDIYKVNFIAINKKTDDIEIEFKDDNLKKSIVLVIKKIGTDVWEQLKM